MLKKQICCIVLLNLGKIPELLQGKQIYLLNKLKPIIYYFFFY